MWVRKQTAKPAEPAPEHMPEQQHRKPEKVNKTGKCILVLKVMTKD